MCSEPRVEDDDDSRYVFEGFGPVNRTRSVEQRSIQEFMGRVVRDVQAHPEDYGALRDPLVLLAENYARTCHSREELDRRLRHDGELDDHRGPAAYLLRRIWTAQVEADLAAGTD